MHTEFRLRKGILYQGLAFTSIFLVATLSYCSLFFIEHPAAHGFRGKPGAMNVAYFGLAVFGAMTLMSAYILLAYFVERIGFYGTMICVRSVFQNKQFDISSLQELRWISRSKGGTLRFRTATNKAILHLYGFSNEDKLQIIHILRKMVPHGVQTGWNEFCHFVALPIRTGRSPRFPGTAKGVDPMSLPENRRVFITRRRYDWIFGGLLALAAIGATVVLLAFGIPDAFGLLLAIPFFWVLLRYSIPKEGTWQAKWTSTKESKYVGLAQLVMPAMFVLMLAFKFLGWNPQIVMWSGAIFLLILCIPVVSAARKREAHQRDQDAAEIETSVEQWEAANNSAPAMPIISA